MMDLQVLAFQTDMTRVITLCSGARGQQSQLPRDRRLRRAPLDYPPSERSGEDRQRRQDRSTSCQEFRLPAGAAEGDAGWRRQPAGPLDHRVRQRYWPTAIATRITTCPWWWRAAARDRSRADATLRFPKETPLNNLYLNILDKAGVSDREASATAPARLSGRVDEVRVNVPLFGGSRAGRVVFRRAGSRLRRS